MSSIRGIGDGYAFQRLLWLLVGTVIVPTILLSLFGVAAIRNQGAAVLHELDRLRSERLEIGARGLADAVGAIEDGALERSVQCRLLPACSMPGTTSVWSWRTDTETVPIELHSAGIAPEFGRDGQVVCDPRPTARRQSRSWRAGRCGSPGASTRGPSRPRSTRWSAIGCRSTSRSV